MSRRQLSALTRRLLKCWTRLERPGEVHLAPGKLAKATEHVACDTDWTRSRARNLRSFRVFEQKNLYSISCSALWTSAWRFGVARSGYGPTSSSRGFADTTRSQEQDQRSDTALTPFVLTDIGEGIVEVEILRWYVREGDFVRQFDPLVEVQSDKATVDITSRFQGIVRRIPYQTGDLAKVGEPLCFIELSDGTEESPTQMERTDGSPASVTENSRGVVGQAAVHPTPERPAVLQQRHEEKASSPKPSHERVRTTPALRGLARTHGVDLSQVPGSGPGGRILKSDLETFLSSHEGASSAASLTAHDSGAERPSASNAPNETDVGRTPEDWRRTSVQRDRPVLSASVTSEPIRGLRRAMAKSMAAAAAVPHLVYGEEVTVDRLIDLRKQLGPVVEHHIQGKLSYMPFFIKATSMALEGFPILNATLDDPHDPKYILYQRDHNISVAIDTPGGLIVPNIKQVQRLSVFQIARELRRLQALAQAGTLGQEDLSGGTFALSNIGSIGGIHASPVIMVPASCD
ncbi:hypothetical protein F1559_002257 [Cyanidiococcus yangmingshanensis]|uniref:Dihydrolipoamide acetyltransferase component of pyruvate dehydrogenase complex n=1 Tax=Cyanidiococcus yangmingshanensis TaxID=2690220 RepID=A0A7J7ILZ3_9RHOD|nr:hypothetical protein F1559_002257 [Cyanidiococcus yangmingshanensis]